MTSQAGEISSSKKRRSSSLQSTTKRGEASTRSRVASDPEVFKSVSFDVDTEEKEDSEIMIVDEHMTVIQLQNELRKLGEKLSGRKQELIERLREARENPKTAVSGKQFQFTHERTPRVPRSTRKPKLEATVAKDTPSDTPGTAATTTTTTTTTTSQPSNTEAGSSSSSSSLSQRKPNDPSNPEPPAPSTNPPPLLQPPAPNPAGPFQNVATAVPVVYPPLDNRFIRVQYEGKAPDTIKFDINDKLVLESVSATLRNLFPDQKVNLDPKLDIEPVYLLDEYSELHIVTLDFLKKCPNANDPPSPIYRVCKGPLTSTIPDSILKFYATVLAVGSSILSIILAVSLLGSRTFFTTPRFNVMNFFLSLHDWFGFGYVASLLFTVGYILSAMVFCAYLSPSFRFGIKSWYPRLRALQVDVAKAINRLLAWVEKQKQLWISRITGDGKPLPASLGLGIRANWLWLVANRYFTSDLMKRVREHLPEMVFVTFVSYQLMLSPTVTVILIILSFGRPKQQTLRQFWLGEINLEDVVSEILWNSFVLPGAETNLEIIDLLGPVEMIQLVGMNEEMVKVRWNPPSNLPEVETNTNKYYSVGVSRYVVNMQPLTEGREVKMEFAAPGMDWNREITLEEMIYGLTVVVQTFFIHASIATVLGMVLLYACTTSSSAKSKSLTVIFDQLIPNTEYEIVISAYDDLNRKGLSSDPIVFKTKAKTYFRRLLLVSEEVQIKPQVVLLPPVAPAVVVPGPAAPPPPPPPVSLTKGHIRYAGVVWNMAMEEKETELFLRTLRCAMLPDPRKEKFEADFVLSTESKTTHQVISLSYLRTLASSAYVFGSKWSWYSDPLLIAHPPGTRHTFGVETIYNHMIFTKSTTDWILGFFTTGTIISYYMGYAEAYTAGNTSQFWNDANIDMFRTFIQMLVFSNMMVIVLQLIKPSVMGALTFSPVYLVSLLKPRIEELLNRVAPGQKVTQVVILTVTSLLLSIMVLYFNGISVTGLAISGFLLYTARTFIDYNAVAATRDRFLDVFPNWIPRLLTVSALAFSFSYPVSWILSRLLGLNVLVLYVVLAIMLQQALLA